MPKNKRNLHLPKEFWDLQAARALSGVCCHQITKESGASDQTVRRQLRLRGVPKKSRGEWISIGLEYRRRALASGKKTCRICLCEKPLLEFTKASEAVDGRSNQCYQCFRAKMAVVRSDPEWKRKRVVNIRRYRGTQKGHIQMLESARRAIGRPSNRFTSARQGAKKKGRSWTLEREDYFKLIKMSCTYCQGDLPPYGSGLDRVDNSLGYDKSNLVPCCALCNLTRANRFTYDEMISVIGPAIKEIRSRRGIGPAHIKPDFTWKLSSVWASMVTPQPAIVLPP